MAFFQKVYQVVRSIPPGKVMSYGQVAAMAGNPRMARQVGWALHACQPADQVPWQRVVTKEGRVASYDSPVPDLQRRLLEGEGVRFDREGRVCREDFLFP